MILQDLTSWILQNKVEVIATVSGIIGVFLTARQVIWCWPVALINVILSGWIFWFSLLYLDFALQIFYFFMTLYGWYYWLYGGEAKTEAKVSKIPLKELALYFITTLIAAPILGYVFTKYTNAALPYWDSLVFVWGVIGTIMMAKKYIENWILWIINDLVCVGIYFVKDLYGFTFLYLIFTLLAVFGYIEWRKDFNLRKDIYISRD
ncbi:MAG: nicotinamide riboside transporter PnuC [Bacteroidota bacterium]